MTPQDLSAAITAVFIIGMIWLRTRMHYAQRRRGPLRLLPAGRAYFAAALALLALGWFITPFIGRSFWPAAHVTDTLTRVVWFLLTYYVFIIVHRAMHARGRALSALKEDTSMEGVAGCALWLVSDLGRSTTGEVVHVDAGFHIMGLPSEEEAPAGASQPA